MLMDPLTSKSVRPTKSNLPQQRHAKENAAEALNQPICQGGEQIHSNLRRTQIGHK